MNQRKNNIRKYLVTNILAILILIFIAMINKQGNAALSLIGIVDVIVIIVSFIGLISPIFHPGIDAEDKKFKIRALAWGIATAIMLIVLISTKSIWVFLIMAFCGFWAGNNGLELLSRHNYRNSPHDDTEDWLTSGTPLPPITGDHFVPSQFSPDECIHYNNRTYSNCSTCARRGTNQCKYY